MATPEKMEKTLSLDTKFEIITPVDSKMKSKIRNSQRFRNKPQYFITMILKQRATIVETMESGEFSSKQRSSPGSYAVNIFTDFAYIELRLY